MRPGRTLGGRYVNGAKCVVVKLSKAEGPDQHEAKRRRQEPRPSARDAGAEGARFALDPQGVQLFPGVRAGEPDEACADAELGTLLLKCRCLPPTPLHPPPHTTHPARTRPLPITHRRYARIASGAWREEEVREQLHRLRSADDEADAAVAYDAARFQALSLQPLYAKPPPVWMHPAFAAEFADGFIGGTGLERHTAQRRLELVLG